MLPQSLQFPQFQLLSNPDGIARLRVAPPAPGTGLRPSRWRHPATTGGTPPRSRPSMIGPGPCPDGLPFRRLICPSPWLLGRSLVNGGEMTDDIQLYKLETVVKDLHEFTRE